MISGATYRHCSTLDTDIYVHGSKSQPNGDLDVIVTIFDRTHNYIYEQGNRVHTIKAEDIHKWELIS